MPLYGDGRSGTFSATVTQFGGYKSPASPTVALDLGSPRLLLQPSGPVGPKFDTFTDDFTTADSAKWQYPVTGIAVSGGTLNVSCSTAYPTIFSTAAWDLTGSSFYFEMPSTPAVGLGTTQTYIGLFQTTSATDGVSWEIDGSTLMSRFRVGNVTTNLNTATYSGTSHRWLRISEAAGVVTFATSPDGATWTTFGSTWASTISLTSLYVQVGSGYYGAETAPGVLSLDNVNLQASETHTTSGTATATASATGATTTTRTKTGTGSATASASGSTLSIRTKTGTASATATATRVGSSTRTQTGTATATATAARVGASVRTKTGTASASASASGTTAATRPKSGTASASATTSGSTASQRVKTGTATASASASGTTSSTTGAITSGTATATASATAVTATTRTKTGTASAAAAATRSGSTTRTTARTAPATASATASTLTLRTIIGVGQGSASAAGQTSTVRTRTGTATATASATISGVDTYHPHVYVTATLTTNGVGSAIVAPSAATAVLTPPSGFGEGGFGEGGFGGWRTTVTATVAPANATATLAGNGQSTATLAGNGVSTAVLSEVPALAELQLV